MFYASTPLRLISTTALCWLFLLPVGFLRCAGAASPWHGLLCADYCIVIIFVHSIPRVFVPWSRARWIKRRFINPSFLSCRTRERERRLHLKFILEGLLGYFMMGK
jgi:hypothetical protein